MVRQQSPVEVLLVAAVCNVWTVTKDNDLLLAMQRAIEP